jgi:hypothetical protein
MSKGKNIPVPSHAIEFAKRVKAKAAIENMQLELMLLKHLVATLDSEHDYVFNQDSMTLVKVLKDADEKDNLQLGVSEDKPFRGQVPIDGGAKGLRDLSDEPIDGKIEQSEGDASE